MSKVNPVPEGYHTLIPYLNLKGAAQAIEFYKKAFGAEVKDKMEGPGGAVMHAELKIGDSVLMLSEAMQDPPTVGGVFMYVPDVDAVFKRAVDAGAKVKAPLMDMFWGDRFGRVTDPFGITWAMASRKEIVSPQEMQKRMQAEMAKMGQNKPN